MNDKLQDQSTYTYNEAGMPVLFRSTFYGQTGDVVHWSTTFEYDQHGLLLRKVSIPQVVSPTADSPLELPQYETYHYNSNGQLMESSVTLGQDKPKKKLFRYEGNELIEVRESDSVATHVITCKAGVPTTYVSINADPSQSVTHQLNEKGYLVKTISSQPNRTQPQRPDWVEESVYTYDPQDRLATSTYYLQGKLVATTSNTYDDQHNPYSMIEYKGMPTYSLFGNRSNNLLRQEYGDQATVYQYKYNAKGYPIEIIQQMPGYRRVRTLTYLDCD